MNSNMNKIFYIFKSTTKKHNKWQTQIDEWIEKYLSVNKNEGDEVIYYESHEKVEPYIDNHDKKQIVLMGYDLSVDVKKSANLLKNEGYDVSIIENLCCDTSLNRHRNAVDFLRLNGYKVIRDYEFMREDIDNFIRSSLAASSGRESNFDENTPFHYLGYDSLDVVNLAADLEEEYNIYICASMFGKLWKYKDFPRIFAKHGQLSNIYKTHS